MCVPAAGLRTVAVRGGGGGEVEVEVEGAGGGDGEQRDTRSTRPHNTTPPMNVHGDAPCFIVKTWARRKATRTVFNNGWRRLAVGGWRLAGSGWWRLVVPWGCPYGRSLTNQHIGVLKDRPAGPPCHRPPAPTLHSTRAQGRRPTAGGGTGGGGADQVDGQRRQHVDEEPAPGVPLGDLLDPHLRLPCVGGVPRQEVQDDVKVEVEIDQEVDDVPPARRRVLHPHEQRHHHGHVREDEHLRRHKDAPLLLSPPPPPPRDVLEGTEGGGGLGAKRGVYQKWPDQNVPTVNCGVEGGGVGMTVYCSRRLLADRHSLPFEGGGGGYPPPPPGRCLSGGGGEGGRGSRGGREVVQGGGVAPPPAGMKIKATPCPPPPPLHCIPTPPPSAPPIGNIWVLMIQPNKRQSSGCGPTDASYTRGGCTDYQNSNKH